MVTLMSTGQTGGMLSPVSVAGGTTHVDCTLTLSGPATNVCGATVLGSVDGNQYLPIMQMAIESNGPNTVAMGLRDPGQYISYDALLNYITPGGFTATVTMTY